MGLPVTVITTFLTTMGTLFTLVLTGFLGARTGWFPPTTRAVLAQVLGGLALPALLFQTLVRDCVTS
jgi:predicted permease